MKKTAAFELNLYNLGLYISFNWISKSLQKKLK